MALWRRPEIQVQDQSDDNNGRTTDAAFPTIYKLSDDDGYLTPYHVSTGPYYRRTSFLFREAEKQNYLIELSNIAARERQVKDFESYLSTKISEQLRSSAGGAPWSLFTSGGSHQQDLYYGDIPLQEEEESPSSSLARRLLLDGCYLFANFVDRDEAMRTTTTTTTSQRGGSSTTTRTRGTAAPHSGPLVRDTWYLLQNQIPFFVLEEIYMRVTGRAAIDARRAFTSYARTLLWNQKMYYTEQLASNMVLQDNLTDPSRQNPPAEADINTDNGTMSHLLHLVRTFFKPRRNPPADGNSITNSSVGPWHRATEYRMYANITFKSQKINGDTRVVEVLSVLDVGFNGGKVIVPRLHLDGHTCTLLHNLMALERHHPRLGTHVTAYCAFMSKMACTKDDVELLLGQGVIDNHLGSPEDVAATLSQLGSSIVLDINDSKRNYLKPLWHHLDKRYKSQPQMVAAWLSQNYFTFRNVTVLGVLSALILLVTGVLSAVYQILAYKHPPPPCGH
ncbi:UPF0481 protein At3g47200-like [Miscanthus floridulus]|uniref:UPF0481 protein At3g47200-like n=1 Tax=Miscanthus floridulus TaxID=154761 RepID=UPI0034589983